MCKNKGLTCWNDSEDKDGYCTYCNKNGYGAAKPPKEVKPIPKVSEKEKARQKDYKNVRAEYLKNHPVCEMRLKGCKVKATQIHHEAGRIGKLLTDTDNFKACCTPCHRITEDNPQMAKQKGLSKSRLNT